LQSPALLLKNDSLGIRHSFLQKVLTLMSQNGNDNNRSSIVQPGQKTVCPGCNSETIVKTKVVMDGWTCIGHDLVCALCGYRFAPMDTPDGNATTDSVTEHVRRDVEEFFGDVAAHKPTADELFADGDIRTQFCKDCRHYYHNAFHSACLLTKLEVDPMSDCNRFRSRETSGGDV
jgi:transcription elongation factor Elf1